jgi:hypothetical protein
VEPARRPRGGGSPGSSCLPASPAAPAPAAWAALGGAGQGALRSSGWASASLFAKGAAGEACGGGGTGMGERPRGRELGLRDTMVRLGSYRASQSVNSSASWPKNLIKNIGLLIWPTNLI